MTYPINSIAGKKTPTVGALGSGSHQDQAVSKLDGAVQHQRPNLHPRLGLQLQKLQLCRRDRWKASCLQLGGNSDCLD